MRYEYPISGNGGEPSVLVVDTDSPEFQRRVAWISDMAGLAPPKLIEYVNHAPAVAGANPVSGTDIITVFAQLEWRKNDRSALGEARLVMTHPQGILGWLNLQLGLGMSNEAITHMEYHDPIPPAPVEDWQAPASPMGEPLPPPAGRYKSKGLGHKAGDLWVGPSGAIYKLTNIGGFFLYLAWIRQ